jgi:hypothetical protein
MAAESGRRGRWREDLKEGKAQEGMRPFRSG